MSVLSARPDDARLVASSPSATRLRRPSWRDRRLVVGLLLVLGSTVVGAHLLGSPQGGTPVWVARHDLAAGTVLRGDDLAAQVVHLPGLASRYVSAAAAVPRGTVLIRPIGRGELLPAAAVTVPGAGGRTDARTVTVPVERFHVADDLARGDRVDVYATPHAETGDAAAAPTLLAASVVVVDVEDGGGRFGGTGDSLGVVVTLPDRDVARLVGGLGSGTVDVVRVTGAGS